MSGCNTNREHVGVDRGHAIAGVGGREGRWVWKHDHRKWGAREMSAGGERYIDMGRGWS